MNMTKGERERENDREKEEGSVLEWKDSDHDGSFLSLI